MESLSRAPHRRKSSRNPYDDVFLSGVAEREALEAHEYAEIFSGPSSIPVLELSGLDERVGSGDSRSSKLDYSNIFRGFRNADVGFPCAELFSGSANKTQLRNPADARVPTREPDSLHSAGNSKISSVGASDQSADEQKKQFNVSFNRTHQRNTDTSNGKTHIAQQAVPAFTHFVDVTHQLPKTDNGKTINTLKHDVSRTWSFSSRSDTVKGKGEISREKSHIPDLKPQPRAPYFVPKKDASEKNDGEFSSPYYGEDFDENSVAAASAAALKRAIDQAQESIRLAKMIMDRKKEGYQNGSKARQRGRPKVSVREGEIDRDLKKNNSTEKYADLDPTAFDVGIDGKYIPSLIHDDAFISAAKIEVECVCKNAAEGEGHEAVLSGDGELFPSNGSQRESIYIDEMIELEKTEENIEKVEAHSGGADIPVLLVNECQTANLEQRDVGVDHAQGPEVAAELVERALDTSSQRFQEVERNMVEATFDHAEGPGNKVERVLNTPQRTRRQWKVSGKASEYFGMGQKDGIFEVNENDMDDKGKKESEEVINVEHGKKSEEVINVVCAKESEEVINVVRAKEFEEVINVVRVKESEEVINVERAKESEEVINVERATELKSDPDSIIGKTCNLSEDDTLGQVDTERESERRENGYILKTYDDEANLWFESEEQMKEALEKETNTAFVPEIEMGKKRVDEAHEPEIDNQNENHAHDGDEQILPEEIEHNEVEEIHMSTSECEVPETIEVGEINCAQVENSAEFYDSKENCNNRQYEEDAYEEHINEPVDVNSSSSSTIFSETREACNVDLEDYQTVVENHKENYTIPEVIETFSETKKDKEVEHMFHQEDMRTETLYQTSSEENFFESNLNNFDSLSSDGSEMENLCFMGADPEEVLPEDKGASNTSKIHDVAQEFLSQSDVPHVHSSDIRTSESDPEEMRQVAEEASGSDEGSVSTSSHENINGFSVHDSEECDENANDATPKNEELKDDLDLVPNERKLAEGASSTSKIHDVAQEFTSQRDVPHVHSSDIRTSESDPEEMRQVAEEASGSDEGSVSTSSHENINGFSVHDSEECDENANGVTPNNEELKDDLDLFPNERKLAEGTVMESEGAGERDPNTENNKGNLAGSSPTEEKDAKVEDPQNHDKDDYQQRIDAIKRGREREKDRKVVERAIREARERAFTETRERVERAAVEKATAEARQRAMAEAREKASYVKLRAERAAVERATAEARERALEKALSLKTMHMEGRTPEKVSGSSGSNGLKHSFSSSDLENGTESAQRRKARLERHQRIMERAAKALAEKNMRDVLAQKEQAERNRLAESLDADIKRWATGKEKNLRALLSTLQYILGPDSGWQPIPLTDVVTTVAVKKAYRKATLCVHPDKVQQRGATIKQKYICEKVFDLLKAAWNRFNSDER